MFVVCIVVFFQAEDGIRDLVRSRGLGDVYKRQSNPVLLFMKGTASFPQCGFSGRAIQVLKSCGVESKDIKLSLIHI